MSILDHIWFFIISFFIPHNKFTNITNFPSPWSPTITISNFNNLLSKFSLSTVFPNLLNNDLAKSWYIGFVQKWIFYHSKWQNRIQVEHDFDHVHLYNIPKKIKCLQKKTVKCRRIIRWVFLVILDSCHIAGERKKFFKLSTPNIIQFSKLW